MSALIELEADIAELQKLVSISDRPAVRSILEGHVQALRSRCASERKGSALSTESGIEVPSGVVPSQVTAAPTNVFYHLPKHGWEQDSQFVTVLVYDLPGVGAARDSVTCTFEKSSFDLVLPNVEGKHYRLRVPGLDKDINPQESSYKVKKSSVEVRLRKTSQYDHWTELKATKSREEKRKDDADPSAGIMNMMRDMYQNGDDSTKKIIAEAWTKNKDERAGQGAGSGMGGMGAGFGDMGGLGGMGDFDGLESDV